jgi:hypothetical protein
VTRAQNILARVATIAAMTLCVIWLTGLFTKRGEHPPVAQQSHATAGAPAEEMAQAWHGDINYMPAYAALNPYAALSETAAASAFDPGDDYWGLPRSEGYETVAAWCGACHTLQIVMQQRQPRDGWDYLLHWMVEKQGMAEPPADMRAEMLDYLSKEFGG